MKQDVFQSTIMGRIYSLGDEKIDFVRGMELKSVIEMDQHSRNSGNDPRKHNGFRLIASHNYRYRGIDRKGLRWPMIDPLRLPWIEGSLDPHKAEGHHEPNHISPLIEVALGERKGRLLKRCPYIQPISQHEHLVE